MSCTKSMSGTQRIGQGSSSLEGSAEGTVAWTIPASPTGAMMAAVADVVVLSLREGSLTGGQFLGARSWLAAPCGVEVIWRVAKGPKDQGSNDPGPEPPWEPS